tara:strand:- start:1412 stop:1546 length:135 start_codon:yes stop_codon:yes gene_type:complete
MEIAVLEMNIFERLTKISKKRKPKGLQNAKNPRFQGVLRAERWP